MTNTRDAEADLNAAIDAAILTAAGNDWLPYNRLFAMVGPLWLVPDLVYTRIHALERRGLIQSRIWGQGDERQLWLRRVEQEDR